MPVGDLPNVPVVERDDGVVLADWVYIEAPAPPRIIGRLFEGQPFVDLEGAAGPVRIVHVLFLEVELGFAVDPGIRLFLITGIPAEGAVYAEVQDDNGQWHRGSAHPVTRVDPNAWELPRVRPGLQEGAVLVPVSRVAGGAWVSVLINGLYAGGAYAHSTGVAAVEVGEPLAVGDTVVAIATQLALGAVFESAPAEVQPFDPVWPAPVLLDTTYGGQTHLRLTGLRPGFTVIAARNGESAVAISPPPATSEAWVALPFEIQGGDVVEVWQNTHFPSYQAGERLSIEVVVGTGNPVLLGVVTPNTRVLRIRNQVPGHELEITVGLQRWLRTAGTALEVDIGEAPGDLSIRVTQRSPRVERAGEAVSTVAVPLTVPMVLTGFAETATAIAALTAPGLEVVVYRAGPSGDVILGTGWTENRSSASVELFPELGEGDEIRAFVWDGDTPVGFPAISDPSEPMIVEPLPDELPSADILPPAYRGDDRVVVAGNLMGSHVTIESSADEGVTWISLGGHVLADPHGVVEILPIPVDTVLLRAKCVVRGRPPVFGETTRPVDDPGADGPHTVGTVEIVDESDVVVGRYFYPSVSPTDPAPDFAVSELTLVVMAHGYPPPGQVLIMGPSYTGYDYLGQYLASRGVHFFSVQNFDQFGSIAITNSLVGPAIDRLRALYPALAQTPLYLIGHSTGWASIVHWAFGRPVGEVTALIGYGANNGLISGGEFPRASAVMMVAGTLDGFALANEILSFNSLGQPVYPRVGALIEGMNHQGINSEWAAQAIYNTETDTVDAEVAVWNEGSITEVAHRSVFKAILGSFLRATRADGDDWWRAFGTNLPPSVRGHANRFLVQRSAVAGCPIVPIHVAPVDVFDPLDDDPNVNSFGFTVPELPFAASAPSVLASLEPALLWNLLGEPSATEEVEFVAATPTGRSSLALNGTMYYDAFNPSRNADLLVEVITPDRLAHVRFQQVSLPEPLTMSFDGEHHPAARLSLLSLRALRGADPGLDPGAIVAFRFVQSAGGGTALLADIHIWCTS